MMDDAESTRYSVLSGAAHSFSSRARCRAADASVAPVGLLVLVVWQVRGSHTTRMLGAEHQGRVG